MLYELSNRTFFVVLTRIRFALVVSPRFVTNYSGLAFDVASEKKASEPAPAVMIMMCGYPDTAAAWSRLAPHFEKTHHILKLSLPAFEADTLDREHRWGYTIPEIADAFTALVEPYAKRGSKIHIVGLVWGVGFVFLFVFVGFFVV